MKRIFDLLIALSAAMIFLPLILVLIIAVKITSKGPAIYWSDRIGRKNVIFKMAKLRTMKADAPVVATHLLLDPQSQLTPIGGFLRKSSLDELPQLWNILSGDMSLVGPRPALFNQADLIDLRNQYGIDNLSPGLTGWAQLNGRDELSIEEKVKFDYEYLQTQCFLKDLKILWLTAMQVIRAKGVSH
jgi:O-antigen biosynthesis protein WbqP